MVGVVNPIRIAGRAVGPGAPCFVIAEAGVNHNGDLDLARRLVDAAAEAGADAVKFQTFSAERLAAPGAPKAAYQERAGAAEDQRGMLRRLELSPGDHRALMAHCAARGILFLSSPFDEPSADLLDDLDVAAFKVPSGEVVNPRFLAHMAAKGRPMILSTGMADLDEVAAAVAAIRAGGGPPLALLHCVSAYPAEPADSNLRAMATLADAFAVPAGWSDHTPGIEVALAAVALGAAVIEKHLTLDAAMPGPDHAASLEPEAFARLVAGIRTVESALGDGRKVPAAAEAEIAAVARKSLVAARPLRRGQPLDDADVTLSRPGTGLPPAALDAYRGRRLARDVPAGAVLDAGMFL